MTDNELLEAAAKAAGYTLGRHTQCDWKYTLGGREWNPLHPGDDALRLAADLRLTVGYDDGSVRPVVFAHAAHLDMPRCYEPISENAAAAYRRAIVRAAAALSKE